MDQTRFNDSYTLIQSAAARDATAVQSLPTQAALLAESARVRSSQRSHQKYTMPERIGRYRITRELYDGRYHRLLVGRVEGIGGVERKVVLKLLRPGVSHNGRRTRGFLHEERVTGALDHPNVVRLLDSGDSEFGYYMVFEYIQGHNLTEILAASSAARCTMPLDVALSITHGIALALHYIHELATDGGQPLGLVHRNVLPGNVMVREDGFVKLIDFGEVAIAGMEREQSPLEDRLHPYTPPEMTRGGSVDRRGDIYSMGAVLYEASTGRQAVRDPFVERREITDGIVLPSRLIPDYWPELETTVMHMIHPDPGKRFQTAAAVARRLEDMALDRGLVLSPQRVSHFVEQIFDFPPRTSGRAARAGAGMPRGEVRGQRPRINNMGKTRIRLSRKMAPV